MLASLLCACAPSPPPPSEPPAVTVANDPPPPPSDAAPPPPAPERDKGTPREALRPGLQVVVHGRVSETPWQHMMGHVEGKSPEYFDLEDGFQTVIYVAAPVACPGLVELRGQVLEVTGPGKRPGGRPSKADETHRELHIDVSSHRCL